MENLPKAKVRFTQIAYTPDGYLTALDDFGQIWICNSMGPADWVRVDPPMVEIHPTPTPTAGQSIKKLS